MRGGGIFHAKGNDFSLIYFLQLNEKVPAQIATFYLVCYFDKQQRDDVV